MPPKLATNTLIYTIGNIVPQAVSFLLLPVYTRYLTPTDYGIVDSMSVINSVLVVIFTLCMERSITRLFFDYKSLEGQKDFLGTVFIATFSNTFLILAFVFIFSNLVEKIYKSITFYPFYMYAILTCFFLMFTTIPKIYLQVKERARQFVILSLCQFLLTTALTLWYVCQLKGGAEGQLKAGLISSLILFPVFIVITVKIINFRISFKILKDILTYSSPFIPIILVSWVLNMSNRIFIERYFSLNDVGVFSLGFRLSSAILIIMSGFDNAYTPYFFKLANESEQGKNKIKLRKINNTYALVLLFLTFSVALFSKDVVSHFMNVRYINAYLVTTIMVFANFFLGLAGITSWSILQHKKSKQIMVMALIIGALNIMFNFILIPIFGIYGAAFASLITFLIGFLIQYQYSKRCYFIPMNLDRLLIYFISAVLVVIAYHFIFDRWLYVSIISKIILVSLFTYIFMVKIIGVKNIFRVSTVQSLTNLVQWK